MIMEHNLQNIINHTKFQEKLQLIAKEQKLDFTEVILPTAPCGQYVVYKRVSIYDV